MALTDLLTGQPLKTAAGQSLGYLGQAQNNMVGATNNAADAARSFITQGYGDSRRDLGTGYNTATGAINTGANSALGYLDTGNNAAINTLQAGGGAYAPLGELAQRYRAGSNLYGDSLGLNGPEGNARAVSAFQAGPAYNWTLDQGIEALTRQANAAGSPVGGNIMRDTLKFGQGLANQEYGNWQNRLANYNNLELGATSGAAAGNQANNSAIANLYNSGGQNRAQIATGQGSNLADLARLYYASLGQGDIAQGQGLGNITTDANKTIADIGVRLAPQFTNAYTQSAAGDMIGSRNSLDLGMNLAKLATGVAGGIPFGSFFGGGSASVADPTFGGWSLPGQSAASVRF